MTIDEMRQKKADSLKEMRAILDLCDEEKRSMTDEEKAKYEELDKGIDEIKESIKRAEKLEADEIEARKVINPAPADIKVNILHKEKDMDDKSFRNLGEFLYTIAAGEKDERLAELREQQMGVGAKGGYALPEQFRPEILMVNPQEALVRPRAMVIPAGSPPDAKITMPALDQTSAQNMFGGVVITHTGESLTMTETDANLRQVSLEPKEMTAYIVVSDKLLGNWDACGAFVAAQLRKAMVAAEDYDFIRGNGVNRATGFINHAAKKTYTRAAGAGSTTISFADIYNMLANAKPGGSYVWVMSPTVIPALAAMTDAGTHAVWLGGKDANGAAQNALPSTLFGYPIFFSERSPAVGSVGDICLVDLSYYLVKDGSGPFVAQSEHVYFTSNRTVFKVRWNVDGHPWLTEPIPLEGATSNTVSPFVVLG